jgi:oxalate decarboxylase/phosphoglucose isomerase-like protein (cupin superfamily)
MEQAREIKNSDLYRIIDLEHRDINGEVIATTSWTSLHPKKVTRGHKHDKEERYYFISGTGKLYLKYPDGRVVMVNVQAGSIKVVPAGVEHQVENLGIATDLFFECYVSGKIERPPFVDTTGANYRKS